MKIKVSIPEKPITKNPEVDKRAFNCPSCHTYSKMHWSFVHVNAEMDGDISSIHKKVAQCNHCHEWSYWIKNTINSTKNKRITFWEMVYPVQCNAPHPSKDLPKTCTQDYLEARIIFNDSPRASAALLRLCIQKICKELGEKGKNINEDIASLVKKGLDKKLQKAFDIVRITGNNAVHPGNINIDDNSEIVRKLFKLVNIIVEELITKSREIDELYAALPENAVNGIKERDS